MELSRFRTHLAGAQVENRWLRWVALGLLLANLVLAYGVLRQRAVVIITPPGLNKAVRITQDQANAAYKKAWGLFLANLLGNVKPGNAAFITATLTPLLAPAIYRQVVASITAQAAQIDKDQVSVSFSAQRILYDTRSGTVYVAGRQTSSGPGSDPVSKPRTYAFTIAIRNYKPMVMELNVLNHEPDLKEHRQ